MGTLGPDIRYGLRMLVKSPGFTLVALVTLALGIGANSAIYSAIHALLLRPLPVRDAERLVMLSESTRGSVGDPISYANFLDWQKENQVFESMAAQRGTDFVLAGAEGPQRIVGAYVSSDYFRTLGVTPLVGRDFLPDDDRPGAVAVVILSERLWRSRFGADAAVVGTAISLRDCPHTIIGVMPSEFDFLRRTDVYVPLGPAAARESRDQHDSLYALARLKESVTLAQARRHMESIALRIAQQYPKSETGHGVSVRDLREAMGSEARTPLLILFAMVSMVLLIACANTSNLLLARAAGRGREIAIRAAVGATRGRLVRQFLLEGIVLGLAGCALGLLLCFWGCEAVVALVNDPEVLAPGSLRPDGSVLFFALVLSVAVGAAVAAPPAWSASRPHLEAGLKEGGRVGVTRSRRHLVRTLVTAEVALAVVLLTCAGLLLRSLHNVLATDPGMDTRNVLSLKLLSAGKPLAEPKLLYRRVAEEIGALPGVQAVATGFPLPLSHDYSGYYFHVEGQPLPPDGRYPHSRNHYITPEYFRVLGLQFLRGRPFDEVERAVVINEAMARTCWPGEDALGKRIAMGRADQPQPWWTVVGVVRDTKEYGFREAQSEVYWPSYGLTSLLVRTDGDPLRLVQAIRARLAAVDRTLAVHDVATLDQRLGAASLPQRVVGLLAAVFAALALVLAAVGIYGVLAHAMAQRRQEIGIRMTLGAEATDVLRLVIREGMLPVLGGVGLGVLGAYGVAGALASQLYGVEVTDPAIHAATPLLLTLVALLACWLPARRAARVDPMVALRYE